jgi:hypothetical protein
MWLLMQTDVVDNALNNHAPPEHPVELWLIIIVVVGGLYGLLRILGVRHRGGR